MLGEEDPKMYLHIEPTIKEDSLIEDLIEESLISKHIEERRDIFKSILGDDYNETPLEIQLKDALVFVDPLDGTKDFVSGYP